MRQFLATAFRMPTWVDAPEETGDSDAHGGIDAPGDSDAPGGSGHLSESGAAASAPESGPEGGPSAGSSAGPAAGTARAGDGTESGRPAREPGPRHRAEPPATSPRALDDAESGARESVRGREDVTGPAAVSPRGDDDGVESGLPEHPGEERRRDVPSESGHGPDGSWTPPPRALEGIDPRLWGRRMEPEVREVPGVPGVPEASEDADGGASAAPFLPSPSAPAAPAQVPATMATPHRDGELRRTFPAFAPRPAAPDGGAFAETWWGNAWTDALERQALDARRLERGRGYADLGKVDAITVTPGLVLAYVRGSRPRPYRVQMRLRTLEDADWERFLDAAADRPGHIAALLDKELPQSLADCGVPLLPGPGDLVPRCSCPDSGHPCKHAAALCYQTARLLDADPFVLLLLRGRGERELLDALSRRSAARAARATRERAPQALPGIRASTALDASRRLAPLPAPLPVPPHPEQPPVYPAVPGGPDPFALDQLATDAAARAHTLLAAGIDPVAELTLWQDAVRLAAARPGSGLTAATRALYATLAAATDRTPADLARAVAAWRQGGLAGLAVLEEPWDPPAGRFDRARPLLLAADLPSFRPWRNRLTHPLGHAQLRLGRDGLWYAYESEPGQDDWWPRGTPDLDPVGALTGLGAAGDL